MLTRNGRNNDDGSFDWVNALLDAGVMAGLGFFGTLAGLGAVGLLKDPVQGLVAAGIACGFEFFAVLATKRGLRESST